MSIIQDIRDKYAKVTVVLIALALIGFILTDYFQSQGRSQGGGSSASSVGSVNGRNIKFDEFLAKSEMTKNNLKAQAEQQGFPVSAALDQQAYDQTWNDEVKKLLLEDELDNLGIQVTKKEMGDVLYGPNGPQDLKSQFTDSATGQYNGARAKQAVDEMLKAKETSPEIRERKLSFLNYIDQLEQQRKTDKYVSLLANSTNVPRWYVEKQNADASMMAKVSYVSETYASIPDSSIKIEDKEIADYINKHKDVYKQGESRTISYVAFSAAPSTVDTTAANSKATVLKAEFDTTAEVQTFLLNQGVNNYYPGYISGKTIQIAGKDSIFRTPVGSIYGPYLDGGSYVLAKMEGVKQMADTAKVRHILISTQTRDSATAYKLIDSLRTAIAKGSNFDSLTAQFSEDPGSKDKGGVYENVFSGQMTPLFNDYIFLNPVGSKGIVKTDFGYHYIEILSQKGNGPGYKIAYLPTKITASKETEDIAMENAMKFSGESKDAKAFDANYEKTWKAKGYNKLIAPGISPTASEIQNLGISRMFVKSIYDASLGEVLKPESIDDKYVVATVTDIQKEGPMSVASARQYVEPMLRNKKKAEMLKQKIGKVTTLEAAATALGGKQIVMADSLRIEGGSSNAALGYEPKVFGAAFNQANKGKVISEPLAGVNGVYVVRVEDITTTPVTNGDVASQRKAQEQQMRQQVGNPQGRYYPINTLRFAANIKDKRGKLL